MTDTAKGRPPPSCAAYAIDIVIDNHNYGRYLSAAIDSALAQDHAPVRVIVVDDGSTDDSRQVLRAYEGRVDIVLKENGGQASAFNAGWPRCRGDAVIFLDSDDVLMPHAARSFAAALQSRPRAVKAHCQMAVIDADGSPTGARKPHAHVDMPDGDVRQAELTSPFDLAWMATSGNAFTRSALARIMPVPEREFRSCGDWYLQHLTALLGDVVSIHHICACYRVHGRNSYEPAAVVLDLEHVRATVRYAAATRRHLRRMAAELGLAMPPGPILSVSDCANRLISRRLDPARHPLPADDVPRLALAGVLAAGRRADNGWMMRLTTAVWFLIVAMAPRRTVRWLAELFLFPQARQRVNPVLARLRRPARRGTTATPP